MHQNFTTILASYKEYLQTLGYATSTVYDYTYFARHFFTYLRDRKGIYHIGQVTDIHIRLYFTYLETKTGDRTGRAFGSSHLNRSFTAIDKLLSFLHGVGLENAPIPTSYSLEVTRLKPIHILSESEILLLYKSVNDTFGYHFSGIKRIARQKALRLVLDLCYGCGLRRSEALHVQAKDIDFDKKVVYVRQGKNYKDRYVPISDRLVRSFMEYVYDYRPYLPNRRQGYLYPFGNTAIGEVISLLQQHTSCEVLQDKVFSLHTLRHSIATHLLQNGMCIEQISSFLGHHGLTSTQLYTHILDDDI